MVLLGQLDPTRVPATSVLVAVVAFLAAFCEVAHAQRVAPGEAVDLRPRTVIVVPFANISGQPEDDWIGTGIAETVTADLDQFGELSVVGREALLDSLNDEAVARARAQALGVAWIVAGGFQRLGDQVRITARIVNVETGTTRETVKIDGRLDELFTLQDRIVDELGGGFGDIAGRESPALTAARRRGARGQVAVGEGEGTTEPPVAAPPAKTPGDAPASRAERSGSNGNGNGGAPAGAVSGGITIGDRPPPFAAAPGRRRRWCAGRPRHGATDAHADAAQH